MKKLFIVGALFLAGTSFAQEKATVVSVKAEESSKMQNINKEGTFQPRARADYKALNQRLKSAEQEREATPQLSAPKEGIKKD